ncbi:MAG: Stf0 family sulfotransferase [Thiolinea sp.]
MKKIIICATARSGSTLLCKELEATGVLGKPKEYYIQAKDIDAEKAPAFWAGVMQRGSSDNGVFAIKVMQQQWPVVEKLHSHLKTPESFLEAHLKKLKTAVAFKPSKIQMDSFYSFYKEATWVFLRREDKLYQAISREMARQTKVCHIIRPGASSTNIGKALGWEKSTNYNADAIYKPQSLLTHIQEICQEEEAWLAFFKQYKLKPLIVSYETVVTSKQYLTDLAKKVGVEINELAQVPVMQVRNELNDEWAERFKQEFPDYRYH